MAEVAVTPKRLSMRSPASNQTVLRVEVKLNREEATRLQESNAQLERDVNQLRATLNKIKEDVKLETRDRRRNYQQKQQENDDQMHDLKKSFADSKVRLQESRATSAKQQIRNVTENINSVRTAGMDVKKIVETSVSDVKTHFASESARVHRVTDKSADPEAASYRSIENSLQSTLSALPESSEFADIRSRPTCELSDAVSFEMPEEQAEVRVRNVYTVIPTHLVRVFRWINECLH